ncbi:unnamed protein product [Penicillium bialowiezense]
MKDRTSWKAGVITSLAVIAACTLLVLTAKGFNRMMIEERCDSDMCHLQPWWAQGLEQTPTEIPTPISSTSPSSMTTDSPHMQLKRASKTTEGMAETAVTEVQPCEAASCNDTQSDEQGREKAEDNTETVTQDDGSKPEPEMDKAEPEEVETQFGCLVNGDCGLGDDADPAAANIKTARVDMNVAMDGGDTGVLRRQGGTGNAGSIYVSVLDMGSVAVVPIVVNLSWITEWEAHRHAHFPASTSSQRAQVPGTNPGVGISLVRVIHDAGGH